MKTPDASPVSIISDNLSLAWAQVLDHLETPGIKSIVPLTLSITGFESSGEAQEVPEIREALDKYLESQDKWDTENVAWTIFPQRDWKIAGGDRELFFETYIDSYPRVQDFNPRNNKRGSYFQRLVDYAGQGKGPNQLKWMLDEYHNHPESRRKSKFQGSTFDPLRDYTSAGQLEFPCLQHVSFIPDGEELIMNSFYATQQIVRKGYGNYLGLARLGAFMAGEMNLQLKQLNVFVGRAAVDRKKKSEPAYTSLVESVREQLKKFGPAESS